MKRFATGILVIVIALIIWVTVRQEPRTQISAPPEAKAETKSVSNPTPPKPSWAVAYDREFWRKLSPPAEQLTPASPAVNVHEVIDRVSHAFRTTEGANPTVNAHDYTASLEGAALRFSPGTNIDLKITTTSAKIGGNEILKPSGLAPSPHYVGNTAQTILDSDAGLIQHFEARAQGVELTWILQHRPETKGPLQIEAALDGLDFAGESHNAFHFADSSGTPRVRISNATLVDSSGNRAEVPTKIIDSRFVVQVPADLLATAAYPIAIDPLISAEFGMDRPVSALSGGENAKVASNGADYLVVWHDWRSNRDIDIYATRVSRDGWILDPNGLGIRVGYGGQDKFAVASNGSDYFIVWTEYGNGIMGARLASDGKLLDPEAFLVAESPLFPSRLAVAGNGDNYLVLWRDNRDNRFDIYGNVVRASDRHVSSQSGIKLVEDSFMESTPSLAAHLGGFVAVWRSSYQVEGAMFRIQDDAIIKIAALNLSTGGNAPAVASGPGGILVAWQQVTVADQSSRTDIYGQLLSPTGQPNSAQFPICTAPQDQTRPVVAANTEGFIVAWQDNRRGAGLELTNDVYFARVANTATVSPANGQLVAAEGADVHQNQIAPDIASNGQQNLLIWTDMIYGVSSYIRAARILPDGTNLDPRGLPVTVATINSQQYPAVAASSNGFLVAWIDQRNGSDIYGARFTRDGKILDPAGIPISITRAGQNYLALTSNGTDYFAVWADSRNFAQNLGDDIYGARITGAGIVRDPNGLAINSTPGYDFFPKAASDGTNFLAVWQHLESRETHVQTRVIQSEGDPLASPVRQITGALQAQYYPSVASNGREYIVVWSDGEENNSDAYGQRLDHSGAPIGAAFAINTLPKRQVAPLIASNGDGYFVTWLEGNYDTSNFDPQSMLGTRLGATGQVLDVPPIVVQPTSHYYFQRALTSDGVDYVVLWQVENGSIQGVRISGADGKQIGNGFFVATSSGGLNQPSIAATGGKYLVAYSSADGAGNFSRVRGRTIEFNLPDPWLNVDVGWVPTPGTAGYKDGTFTIAGSGGGTVGSAFHFVYQTLEGDGQIIARINNFSTLGGYGSVGLMIRQNLDPASPFAFIGHTGKNETIFERRRGQSGDIRAHPSADQSLPMWFKLIRAGDFILAYQSQDGITWQRFDTTTIYFGERVLIGLAINSESDALSTSEIDQVSIWRFQAPIDPPLDPPAAPTLTIVSAAPAEPAPDSITLRLTNTSDANLQLESSTNLIDWIPVQSINDTESTINITQPPDEMDERRFYRIAPAD